MVVKNNLKTSVIELSMLLMVLVWSQSCFAVLCKETDLPVADKMYFNPFVKLDLPPTLSSLVVEACPDDYSYSGLWRYVKAPTEAEPDPPVVLSCYRDAYKTCPHPPGGHCDPSITFACGACDGSSNILRNVTPLPVPYCYGDRVKHICKMNNSDPWYHCKRGYSVGVSPEQCPKIGNPCVPSTGNKIETITDYVSVNGGLKVQRFYKSQGVTDSISRIGKRWQHNYAQRIDGNWNWQEIYNATNLSPIYDTPQLACRYGWNAIRNEAYRGKLNSATARYRDGLCEVSLNSYVVAKLVIHNTLDVRKDHRSSVPIRQVSLVGGRTRTFIKLDGQWQNVDQGTETFKENGAEFILRNQSGETSTYDASGALSSIKFEHGARLIFTYGNGGELVSVSDQFGGRLNYHYNGNNLVSRITTPDGDLNYYYDSEDRLVSVIYPDNSAKIYHYEDSDFPYHLTGITDENNNRYATWQYDEEGRAIVSEHSNGAERIEFIYNPDGTTAVTDANGAQNIYHFTVQKGQMKVDYIEGDRCTTCSGGDIQAYSYDSNGFIASKTDWNGNTTTYTRDDQGRELSRTEASGTPQARTITTTWDTTLNKPLTVTDPEQITEYTYDTEGRLLSRQQSPIQ
ncbi:MAG: DUF6531 domain-containing protein [Candidatus Thiodiazotropha taylori]|uniref:DUF6531 domain-containing protein n=1 Tax=Candidatus Thiodiazotropha taylori TaxID=2792791 RepID=A0A9E4KD95_9GAMM|nr:DUF6531 domain-containing protein [Candidatus Thiodiazotropha taylori]MCW4257084.1 DUF6531 domain-containing protein [Candidatus Thiodiazotropha taylori]